MEALKNVIDLITKLQGFLVMIIALAGSLITIKKFLLKPLTETNQKLDRMIEENRKSDEAQNVRLKDIEGQLAQIRHDNGKLWKDRLVEAHTVMMERGWCTAAEKQRLVELFDSYIESGHNSISHQYRSDILGLPESLPK